MSRLDSLLDDYERDHRHPANRVLHLVGIPLIATSVALVFVEPIPAAIAFAGGWGAQFLGHAIEGRKPSFTRHPIYMGVGAAWYLRTLARVVRPRCPTTNE